MEWFLLHTVSLLPPPRSPTCLSLKDDLMKLPCWSSSRWNDLLEPDQASSQEAIPLARVILEAFCVGTAQPREQCPCFMAHYLLPRKCLGFLHPLAYSSQVVNTRCPIRWKWHSSSLFIGKGFFLFVLFFSPMWVVWRFLTCC